MAYYAYLIIGWDLDTMSPKGGTEQLQMAQSICNNAQSLQLSAKGWKAFDEGKNRYAVINDYLDGAMEPFRLMQYEYYRKGLDQMAENAERGRAAITASFEQLAKNALIREEHNDMAYRYIENLLIGNDEDPYHIRDRGLVLAQMGAYPSALKDLEFFVERCPEDPTAALIRTQLLELKGEIDKDSFALH